MRDRWPAAWQVFGLAFALRFGMALCLPNLHHPDEIFQSVEQAHRIVFGNGLVPWEFRTGARSWLLPGLLMGPMWVGKWLAPGTDLFLWASQALLAALSAMTAVVAWWWGRRTGPLHALLAALVIGIWFECVHLGAKALSEVVASVFLFTATWLCSADTKRGQPARPLLAGLCLGLTLGFRFHLAPAVVFMAWWGCRGLSGADRLRLLVAACIPIVMLGILDAMTWGEPFASVTRNVTANLIEGISTRYGTSSSGWYALQLQLRWDLALPAVLGLAAWRARWQALPMFVALLVLISHSFIAHKEYRFIYPALPLLLFLAAEGSADACHALAKRLAEPWSAMRWGMVFALMWALTSACLAVSEPMMTAWHRARGGLLLLPAAREAEACGVAISGLWSWSGGYSQLHADVPLHLLQESNRPAWNTRAFNAWITPAAWDEPRGSGYIRKSCQPGSGSDPDNACLWIRPGNCEPYLPTEAQRVLAAVGD